MSITRKGKHCSFCSAPGGPGTDLPLIGGLGAQVCGDCVEHFHTLLGEQTWVSGAQRTVPWDTMSDGELLATLPQIMASAEQNVVFAHEWVDLLREREISWAQIGRALGVSRQAAWERFSKKTGDKGATA